MRLLLTLLLAPFVVVAAVLLIGPYTFLPSVVELSVARDLRDNLGLAETPGVNLESDPPLEMLAGRFSDGRVVLRDAELGGVRASRATIDLDPFDVAVVQSLREGATVSDEPLSGDLRVEVPEAEIERLARAGAGAPVDGVEISGNGVSVASRASAFGVEVPVRVDGDLGLRDGRLAFEPRDLSAGGVPVPDDIADDLLAGAGFAYPLEDLPYGTEVTGARTLDGRLVLTGRAAEISLEAEV